MKGRDADDGGCADVLAVVGLRAGTMCHLASTTVMTVLIISIEGNCRVFCQQMLHDIHSYLVLCFCDNFIVVVTHNVNYVTLITDHCSCPARADSNF